MAAFILGPIQAYNKVLHRYPLTTKSLTSGLMYGAGDILCQVGEAYHDKKSIEINWKRVGVMTAFGTLIGGPMYHYWFAYLDHLPMQLLQLRRHRHKLEILRAYNTLKRNGIVVGEMVMPKTEPYSKYTIKAVKIAADQLVFSSIYTLVFFMGIGTANALCGVGEEAEDKPEERLSPALQKVLATLRALPPTPEIEKAVQDIVATAATATSFEKAITMAWNHTKKVYGATYAADCVVWPPLQLINFTFIPVQYQVLYVNICNLFWNTFLSFMANGHGHGQKPPEQLV